MTSVIFSPVQGQPTHAPTKKNTANPLHAPSHSEKIMQFIDIAHALATAGIYAGLATVGALFVSHLASYRPKSTPTPAPQPEPTPEPEPVAEPVTIEPEVIEPESEPVDRVQELYDFYRGMTLRELRTHVKGRVRGIRNTKRDVLARRLAEAVAAAA